MRVPYRQGQRDYHIFLHHRRASFFRDHCAGTLGAGAVRTRFAVSPCCLQENILKRGHSTSDERPLAARVQTVRLAVQSRRIQFGPPAATLDEYRTSMVLTVNVSSGSTAEIRTILLNGKCRFHCRRIFLNGRNIIHRVKCGTQVTLTLAALFWANQELLPGRSA